MARTAKAPNRKSMKAPTTGVRSVRTASTKRAAKSVPKTGKATSKADAAAKRAGNAAGRRKPVEAVGGKTARSPSRKPRAPQRFAFSHLHASGFDGGLRAYAQYRDLGMKALTGGLVQAHVIRFVPPCRPEEVSKLHYHDVEFQMIYVLKGWIRSEFAGEGAHTFEAGSCWIQPPRIEHKVLDYSDDCEVLEIVMPADFETVTLD